MRSLLSFFTVIPIQRSTLEGAARNAYLLPLVGLITGAPAALVLLLGYALPSGVVATLALGAALLASGLHHTDGVLDVGDALMVRGDPALRRAVLEDTRVGVGGIGALFLVYAPALAALAALAEASPVRAVFALLAAEVAGRSAMLLLLASGKPAKAESSSVPFVRYLRGWRKTAGAALALIAPAALLLPLGGLAPLAVLTVPLTVLLALRVSRRAFGGIGGDVVGATGELARAVLLVILSATL